MKIITQPVSQTIYAMQGSAASSVMHVAGTPAGTISIGAETYTFAGSSGPFKIVTSSNINTQCINIVSAINSYSLIVDADRTRYRTSYSYGYVTVFAKDDGAAGNGITVASNATNLDFDCGYLQGGYDAVADSAALDFVVEDKITNLRVGLEWSDDGGHTWSNKHFNSMGEMGEYSYRTIWRRLGRSRDRIFRLSFTLPLKAVILGAYADIQETAG